MIYRLPRYASVDDPVASFAFVHIPRTAGTSITHALAAACEDAQVGLYSLKHAAAPLLFDRFRSGKEWWASFRFSLVRSPWEIIESDYRLCMAAFEVSTPADRLACELEWWLKIHRVAGYQDFAGFVREEYLAAGSMLRPGGFWRTWCCGSDGEDLGVRAFRFERLQSAWEDICEAIGLSPAPQLPWLNRARSASPFLPLLPACLWTPALLDAVGERCEDDLRRFGFTPPLLMPAS